MPKVVVTEVSASDLIWNFTKNHETNSIFSLQSAFGGWSHFVSVDPFPAYPHDLEQTNEAIEVTKAVFPLSTDLELYILPYETPDRMNAWTDQQWVYWDDNSGEKNDPPKYRIRIVFAGKRIPPHPAMTRYLVGHEYGHAVAYSISERMFPEEQQHHRDKKLLEVYRELRGLPEMKEVYGGGNWHKTTGEIFACDFRILMCGLELEYWPHPDIVHPDEVPELRSWWREQQEIAMKGTENG